MNKQEILKKLEEWAVSSPSDSDSLTLAKQLGLSLTDEKPKTVEDALKAKYLELSSDNSNDEAKSPNKGNSKKTGVPKMENPPPPPEKGKESKNVSEAVSDDDFPEETKEEIEKVTKELTAKAKERARLLKKQKQREAKEKKALKEFLEKDSLNIQEIKKLHAELKEKIDEAIKLRNAANRSIIRLNGCRGRIRVSMTALKNL